MRMNASSPERQSLPLVSWPAADREAYAAACRRGDPFEEGGSAALWRPATHAGRIWAYGAWLCHLQRQGVDLEAEAGAERLTSERLTLYMRHLRGRCASSSIASVLGHLHGFMLAVWPRHDWHWLSEVHPREQRLAEPARN